MKLLKKKIRAVLFMSSAFAILHFSAVLLNGIPLRDSLSLLSMRGSWPRYMMYLESMLWLLSFSWGATMYVMLVYMRPEVEYGDFQFRSEEANSDQNPPGTSDD